MVLRSHNPGWADRNQCEGGGGRGGENGGGASSLAVAEDQCVRTGGPDATCSVTEQEFGPSPSTSGGGRRRRSVRLVGGGGGPRMHSNIKLHLAQKPAVPPTPPFIHIDHFPQPHRSRHGTSPSRCSPPPIPSPSVAMARPCSPQPSALLPPLGPPLGPTVLCHLGAGRPPWPDQPRHPPRAPAPPHPGHPGRVLGAAVVHEEEVALELLLLVLLALVLVDALQTH